MSRPSLARALRAAGCAVIVAAVTASCTSGDRAEREREIATLRSQLEEIKKGQDAHTRELARLSGEMKALDAQSTFAIGEVKASSEDRARVKATLDENGRTLRELQDAVDGLRKAATPAPATPPAAAPGSSSTAPDATPEQMYAAAMASVTAEEHARAAALFRELIQRFPQDALASNAQYWIGEAYYRQRDFQEAMVEFRKVVDGYAASPQIPEALLKIGLCHQALKDQARARMTWEQLTREYPGTNAATQARSLLTTSGAASPSR